MLEVRNLTFTYPSNDRTWCFDFQVSPGQCIAIDGPSGSGKSTCWDCSPDFFHPLPAQSPGKDKTLISSRRGNGL